MIDERQRTLFARAMETASSLRGQRVVHAILIDDTVARVVAIPQHILDLGERIPNYQVAKALAECSVPRPLVQPVVLDPSSTRECRIVRKADDAAPPDMQLVTGIVLEPEVVDSQGDIYSADEIEKTAHQWLLDYRNMSLQHEFLINTKARPVESWIQRCDWSIGDVLVKVGTWMLTSKVFDGELWSMIKSGALTGYSIAGLARRTPVGEGA